MIVFLKLENMFVGNTYPQAIQKWWSVICATHSQPVQERKLTFISNFSLSLRLFLTFKYVLKCSYVLWSTEEVEWLIINLLSFSFKLALPYSTLWFIRLDFVNCICALPIGSMLSKLWQSLVIEGTCKPGEKRRNYSYIYFLWCSRLHPFCLQFFFFFTHPHCFPVQ